MMPIQTHTPSLGVLPSSLVVELKLCWRLVNREIQHVAAWRHDCLLSMLTRCDRSGEALLFDGFTSVSTQQRIEKLWGLQAGGEATIGDTLAGCIRGSGCGMARQRIDRIKILKIKDTKIGPLHQQIPIIIQIHLIGPPKPFK